jgi:hypothetical protein
MADPSATTPLSPLRAAFGSPLHEVGEVAAFVFVVVLALIVAAVLQHEKS